MAEIVTRGIVLRYANYRETSRILTLFSRDRGRLTVSAKGCLRPKSRERAATELFTLAEYTLSERTGRYYLNAAALENAFFNLRLDLDSLALATYFTDICLSVLNEEEPQPELFDLLTACLGALCAGQARPEVLRLYFEFSAMELLGFRPELDACASCGSELEGKVWFSAAAGGAVCGNCHAELTDAKPMLPGALALLNQISRWQADALHVLKPADALLADLDKTWRPFLKWHLERSYKLDGFMEKLKGSYPLE